MLVYREQRRRERPVRLLADVRRQLDALAPAHPGAHDRTVRLLIDVGVLEAAVADAIHAEADALHPVTAALRRAAMATGHLTWHSWRGAVHDMASWVERAGVAIGAVEGVALPDEVETSVPEGYAHYGLYPETYLAAAAQAARALPMPRAVCIGIRSIGTSLSAAVAAALEELGGDVVSLTVRPRGHPFARRPRFGADLEHLVRSHAEDLFVLVDEGPGLSGSSLAGTASVLRELGVGDDRIVVMPSWRTDGHSLRSAEAREHWHRHPQFSPTFEETWVASGRLDRLAPGRALCDVSAGAWRPLVFERSADYPAVHPQHERRKFLAGAPTVDPPALLLRFAGLGRYGDGKLDWARAMADAGFGLRPHGIEHGFLIQEFVTGVPAGGGAFGADLLDTMARYLAYVRRTRPARPGPVTDLRAMLVVNVAETLGEAGTARLAHRLDAMPSSTDEPPTRLDARMLPHEWLRTADGYRKADAVDHHDDHFYPGPQDIAWDVVGTCLEFGLTGEARRWFLGRYRKTSGDRTIAARLPLHALAYLAFRLGYAALASEALGATPDGSRFRARSERYRGLLEAELTPGGTVRWRP